MDPIRSLYSDLRHIDLRPNRLKGQNFLISGKVREKIVKISQVQSSDTVVEIGPGTGILSWRLIPLSSRYLMLEIERKLADLLKDRFSRYEHVSIFQVDAVPWLKDHEPVLPKGTRVISNMPYGLCAPVVTWLAGRGDVMGESVLLVQKDFADRITARPGQSLRCALSVISQSRLTIRYLEDVPPRAFYPRPKIQSALIRLSPLTSSMQIDWELFCRIVHICFQFKRKTLRNNLKSILSTAEIENLFEKFAFGVRIRSESLTVENFVGLAYELIAMKKEEHLRCWKPFYSASYKD